MKKGDKVLLACSTFNCQKLDLTIGKQYEVTHGEGDIDKYDGVLDETEFQFIDDNGELHYSFIGSYGLTWWIVK